MKRNSSYKNSPVLYLVATPIGNLNEISSRALDILKSVDLIACEDTRTSGILCSHFGIKTKRISYHNFNEEVATDELIAYLKEGKNIALISDAGYPLISDPGYEIVKKCREEDIAVSTISGPSAAINALVASGLDTNHYLFYGFLNSKQSQAKKELESLKDFPYTIIFYEAPHRILKTLNLVYEVLGDRRVCLARELTKIHEEYITGKVSELCSLEELKGEMVLIVEGNKEEIKVDLDDALEKVSELIKQGLKTKEAIKEIASKYNMSKNELYDAYLKR